MDNFLTDGSTATISFVGVSGRQYGLERRPDVATGTWQRVATTIPEVDGQLTLSNPSPPTGQMYYRLVAEFP